MARTTEFGEVPACLDTYLNQQKKSSGSKANFPVRRSLIDYTSCLPEFDGVDLTGHLERFNNLGVNFSVLDLGCGAGLALACIARDYEFATVHGLSGYDYRNGNDSWGRFTDCIDYRVGDIHDLEEIFNDLNPDIIISVFSFCYFADPLLVTAQSYRRLKVGGIAFIDRPGLFLSTEEADELSNYFKAQGVNAVLHRWAPENKQHSHYSLAIQKSMPLRLPFKYNPSLNDYPVADSLDKYLLEL